MAGGWVIDPFLGSGTTGLVAALNGRSFVGIELKSEYIEIARARLEEYGLTFAQVDYNSERLQDVELSGPVSHTAIGLSSTPETSSEDTPLTSTA
jgi:tRNA G10  N-methylase Trm11